ncbi:MAG: peptide methionine sulfoxide reductase [Bacteroidota bacterium]
MTVLKRIQQLPTGYSEVWYEHKKYGVTKSEFNHGNSFKVYAEELGGTNFISLNYYCTSQREILKPCEMPIQKVVNFLENYRFDSKI